MDKRKFGLLPTLLLVAIMGMVSASAYAQGSGTTAPLTGLVVDKTGGVLPGADVVVKNNATTAESRAITDANGRFSVPFLNPGTYTVTVSMPGFKTLVLPDIPLIAATPASVKAVLDIGEVAETILVQGASEMVQTQTAAVQTTLVVKQIQQLPLVTRTALDYVVQMPGVSTSGSDSRNSTISGLPRETINITLDGVNVQDNRNKGDGFFMFIRPLMDSVEEITVSTATPGAESSGQGATQIRMATRSGSNRFSGAVYNTWRNQAGTTDADVMTRKNKGKWLWGLNTPYYFNKRDQPKTAAGEYFIDDIRLQTPGFRVGGPVMKDKLFYFFNLEWFLWPNQANRAWSVMNETARQGLFTYPATNGSGNKTVDLMAIAAANGQVSTFDPTISKLLADIRQAASTQGGFDPLDQNVDRYTWSPAGKQTRYFPTLRLDYNITQAHRLTFSTRYNSFKSSPDILNTYDPRFPGFPNTGGQFSQRYMWQGTLRSTIGANMVNEARVGYQDATKQGVYFRPEVSEAQFNCDGLGCQSAGGQGWAMGISAFRSITNPYFSTSPTADVAPLTTIEDTLTWLKGKHSISMGGAWTRVKWRQWTDTVVPTLSFGLDSTLDKRAYDMLDPASGNFPGGIDTTWAGYARNLYAVLTGRVTAVTGTAYLGPDGTYTYLGERTATASGQDLGFFISDQWRVRPNLTLTAGLRYEIQFPYTTDALYSRPETWQMVYGITGAGSGSIGQGNLYKPGTMTGTTPLIVPYENGRPAYNTDYNNVAPSVGVAWRPSLKPSFLTKILSTDPVFRGGYSMSYTRLGSNFFDANYSTNPGRSWSATRNNQQGVPLLGQDSVGAPQVYPVLLRDTYRLFPGAFPESPNYPFAPGTAESIDIHYPNWPTPYTHQYSVGFQRELGGSMAIDVRYVGNTNVGAWTTWNMNANQQWSILENGFYDEFRKAQANLQANVAAGRGTTFAYTGIPGTSPLPIFMAYFAGMPLSDPRNLDPANYTNTTLYPRVVNFRTASWYNSVRMYSPALTTIAGTGTSGLQNPSDAVFVANAKAAGLPANFFMANPAQILANSYLETNGGNTRYNALQFDLRRRMTQGLLVQGSYTFAFSGQSWTQRSLREDWFYVDSTGGPIQAFKLNWVFELPFGHDKRWGSGVSGWLNQLIGGWEWDGVGRIQSGLRFDYGGYRLVGMTEKDLQKMFKFYKRTDSTGKERIFMFPEDVITNSILALFTASASTASGYSGAAPTGRYLAPASGPDCVQYLPGQCPGTAVRRVIDGPWYWKFDMGFVKRFPIGKTMRIEARMDLYNIFDVINFTATSATGSAVNDWQVTAAARDLNASQDAGGRITQFGLRFTW